MLRVFAEYTSEEIEKKMLLYLCSPQGSKAYTNCIMKPSLSVLDILDHCATCTPPIATLLGLYIIAMCSMKLYQIVILGLKLRLFISEHLPSLKPRFYSVAR